MAPNGLSQSQWLILGTTEEVAGLRLTWLSLHATDILDGQYRF